MRVGNIRRPDLAAKILEVGVVKFGAFKMKLHEGDTDAPSAPIYLSFRKPPNGVITDGLIEELGALLYQVAKEAKLDFMGVVGIPDAGEPFAEVVSRLSGVPLYFLTKVEGEGRRRVVAKSGPPFFPPATLPVDDLVTEADTKLEAVDAIQSTGGSVRDLLVLVDREQGGREVLERAGFRLHAVWRLKTELLPFFWGQGLVSEEKCFEVQEYLEANRIGA